MLGLSSPSELCSFCAPIQLQRQQLCTRIRHFAHREGGRAVEWGCRYRLDIGVVVCFSIRVALHMTWHISVLRSPPYNKIPRRLCDYLPSRIFCRYAVTLLCLLLPVIGARIGTVLLRCTTTISGPQGRSVEERSRREKRWLSGGRFRGADQLTEP